MLAIDDKETSKHTLERPDYADSDRQEWVEKSKPHKEAGERFDAVIHDLFGEELDSLKGDADELQIKSFTYKPNVGIEILYTRYWYDGKI